MLSSERKPAKPLTRREREIAGLVAEGMTNREIAQKLYISERTAEGHVEQIRNKLGFSSRSQVASWATQNLLTSSATIAIESPPRLESVPSPTPLSRRRVALPHWPFGRAAAIGLLVLAVAVFGLGSFLIYNFSQATAGLAIYTLAGTGVGGYFGDGGPAAKAELDHPTAIAIDQASGAVYILDGNRVRRIVNGSIDTVVGSGRSGPLPIDNTASTSANLTFATEYLPEAHALATDSLGNVYIADPLAHIVWKSTRGPKGTISRFAGTGIEGAGGDGQLATSAELASPSGLAFDSHDNLFIADATTSTLRAVSNGVISTLSAAGMQLNNPHGLAFDHKGSLYIADTSNHRVVHLTPDREATSFPMDLPLAVAVDDHDSLYVADRNQIWRIDATGRKSVYAGNGTAGFGGEGKAPAGASLNRPFGVAVDAANNVFVLDTFNNRVREITRR